MYGKNKFKIWHLNTLTSKFKLLISKEFPGGPVVKMCCFQRQGPRSIPGWGTKIPHALQCGKKKEN